MSVVHDYDYIHMLCVGLKIAMEGYSIGHQLFFIGTKCSSSNVPFTLILQVFN